MKDWRTVVGWGITGVSIHPIQGSVVYFDIRLAGRTIHNQRMVIHGEVSDELDAYKKAATRLEARYGPGN